MIMLVCGLVVTFIESARTAPPAADPDQPAYLNDGVPPQHNPAADLIVPLLLLALQLGIAFQVNRRAFRLSPGRAMAPLGALVGMQLGLAAAGTGPIPSYPTPSRSSGLTTATAGLCITCV